MTAVKTFAEQLADLEAEHGQLIGGTNDLSLFFAREYGWLISPESIVTRRNRGTGCPSMRLRGRVLYFEGPARVYAATAVAAKAAPKRWQARLAERLGKAAVQGEERFEPAA